MPGVDLAPTARPRDRHRHRPQRVHAPAAGDTIARVVALMRGEGMNATVSSIHVNGWYGDHDKLSGARWIVRELLGRELDGEMDRWAYVGDSTNDVLMFQQLPHSIGVANIRALRDQLATSRAM
jgi:hydroxymethylpyrimidine pyrophosphatase-like HAD family hydrolase